MSADKLVNGGGDFDLGMSVDKDLLMQDGQSAADLMQSSQGVTYG